MKKVESRNVPPQWLRTEEASRYLGVSPRTLRDWKKRRLVAFSKLGRRCVIFNRNDLDAAVKRFRVAAVGEVS